MPLMLAGCFFGIQKQPAHRQPIFHPPSCTRCRATHRQLFSQRPKENPMKHKLRAAGISDEPIRTHHGLGYSFAES